MIIPGNLLFFKRRCWARLYIAVNRKNAGDVRVTFIESYETGQFAVRSILLGAALQLEEWSSTVNIGAP